MSPGEFTKNQIDYITINKRFRNAVTKAMTFPGADCNSDHVPVVVEMRVQLKKPKKSNFKSKTNFKPLKADGNLKELYSIRVRNKYEMLREESEVSPIERNFESLRPVIEEANMQMLPKVNRKAKRPWFTDDIVMLMDERRMCKGID